MLFVHLTLASGIHGQVCITEWVKYLGICFVFLPLNLSQWTRERRNRLREERERERVSEWKRERCLGWFNVCINQWPLKWREEREKQRNREQKTETKETALRHEDIEQRRTWVTIDGTRVNKRHKQAFSNYQGNCHCFHLHLYADWYT